MYTARVICSEMMKAKTGYESLTCLLINAEKKGVILYFLLKDGCLLLVVDLIPGAKMGTRQVMQPAGGGTQWQMKQKQTSG
jgi:hypothetical protein